MNSEQYTGVDVGTADVEVVGAGVVVVVDEVGTVGPHSLDPVKPAVVQRQEHM